MSKAVRNYLIDSLVVAVAFIVLFGLIFGLGKPARADTPIPKNPGTYVVDETGVLSVADKGRVEQRLARFERSRPDKPQLTVLIIKNLPDQGLEQFATDTFRQWGVGQKGADNGVLWIVHPKPENHADMRLEIGRRIEADIPDMSASDINVKTAGPYIRKGQYADAIVAVADKIEASLPKPVAGADQYYQQVSKPQGHGFGELLFLAFVGIGTIALITLWLNKRQRDLMARDKARGQMFGRDPRVDEEAMKLRRERERKRAEAEMQIRKTARENAPPPPSRPTPPRSGSGVQTTLAAGAGAAAALAAEAAARRSRERREEEERERRRRRDSDTSSSTGSSWGGSSSSSSSWSSSSSSSSDSGGYSSGGGDSGGGGSSDSV